MSLQLSLFLGWLTLACYCLAVEGQVEITKAQLQDAVDSLSKMLHDIRNGGLGIADLERAIQNVTFMENELSNSAIRTALEANLLESQVNKMKTFFDTASSNFLSKAGSPITPVSCCNMTSSSEACFLAPPGVVADSTLFGELSRFNGLSDQVVNFGAPDGSVITTPSSSSCENSNSRIIPWFVRGARVNARPLEVVVLMDFLEDANMQPSTGITDGIKAAALAVARSLTTRDKVGVVSFDNTPLVAPVNSREVVPICDSTISEMDSFIVSITTPKTPSFVQSNFMAGLQKANDLFSNSTETEKHLLFFVSTTVGPTFRSAVDAGLAAVSSSVKVTIFSTNRIISPLYQDALAVRSNARFVQLNSNENFLDSLGGYAVPNISISNSSDVIVGRNNVPGKGAFLTLTRPVFDNNTNLVGVFYTSISFRSLLDDLFLSVVGRTSLSYVFVLGDGRNGLLHPLLPADSRATADVGMLEPEGVIESYLASSNLASGTAVVKQRLLSAGTMQPYYTYVFRNVSSTYHCHVETSNVASFTICLVLADGERTLKTLDTSFVDVADLYSRYPAPIYHNIMLSAGTLPVCNYFCKKSINTHISFQLTDSSAPEDSANIVNQLSTYITSPTDSNRPGYVRDGVAEEAAVGLAVAESWLNLTSSPSVDFITRRHMAMPSGLYLTYPPAHISPSFQPSRTEWYMTPQTNPSRLTLSPPHGDPLREGSNITLSLGTAVLPPGNPDAPPFAVVSGELTLDSLRVLMDRALPQCRGVNSQYECLLLDDRGNLVYRNDLNNIRNISSFLGRDINLLRPLLFQSGGSWTRMQQCQDLFNVNIDTNRFFTVTVGDDEVVSSPPNHCTNFLIQRVPGMNIVMAVYNKNNNCSRSFCLCTPTTDCLTCDNFDSDRCECPCSCPGNCDALKNDVPLCPLVPQDNPNFVVAQTSAMPTSDESLCFNQECRCRTDFSSCYGVRDCFWCKREQKCVQDTECCDASQGTSCCNTEPRIGQLCRNYINQCFQNPANSLPASCDPNVTTEGDRLGATPNPGSNSSTAIIGGVVGGLLGALLIAFIVGLLVYYQFFRKADPQEETSRESAFDFSNKTALSGGGGDTVGKGKKKRDAAYEKAKEANQEEREATPIKEKDETTTI